MSHDMPSYLRAWLDETLAVAPKPDRIIGAVTTAVHHTPQQRGWLPLLDRGRSKMVAAITSIAAVATLSVAGGLLFTAPEPTGPSPVGAAASAPPSPVASESEAAVDSPQSAPRDSVKWGSKRIYFTPPLELPRGTGGVHDVALVATGVCVEEPSFVEVGPTARDFSDAIAAQRGLYRSGPVDVRIGGHPAKRFVIVHDAGCSPEWAGTEQFVQLWEDQDGTGSGLGMLDGAFAIVIVADVDGERLVFSSGSPGHGPYGVSTEPETELAELEAHADALIASIEIVDPDPLRAAWVTGTMTGGTLVGSPEVTVEDGLTRSHAYHWQDTVITMSDPRLTGTLQVIYNLDTHSGAEGDLSRFSVGSGTYRIENDAGAWEGPNLFLNEGSSGTATVSGTGILVGSGAYEGLSAYLKFDLAQDPGTIVGAIFPGGMPPVATFE